MNKEYVKQHTIFEMITGSKAYGIHNENSDTDIMGVMIPDKSYFYGMDKFEQYKDSETDYTIYNITKTIGLLKENNPNIMNMLMPPHRCIITNSKYWEMVIDNVDLFISKKCKFTYLKYAIAQLKRIKSHRKYLLNGVPKKPERNEYGLKEFSIFESAQLKAILNMESLFNYVEQDKRETLLNELDVCYAENIIPIFKKYLNPDRQEISLAYIQSTIRNQLNTLTYLGQKNYIKDEYIEEAEKELRYQNDLQEWKNYQNWKENRNVKRAGMEEKVGYDLKHASMLILLINVGKEILQTGKINVDRTNIDADFLKEIRAGNYKYEFIEKYANSAEVEMDELYKKSALQELPNVDKINELLINIIDMYLKGI